MVPQLYSGFNLRLPIKAIHLAPANCNFIALMTFPCSSISFYVAFEACLVIDWDIKWEKYDKNIVGVSTFVNNYIEAGDKASYIAVRNYMKMAFKKLFKVCSSLWKRHNSTELYMSNLHWRLKDGATRRYFC